MTHSPIELLEMNNNNNGNGKGKGPIKGYNYKNWNSNYDNIDWNSKWCAYCGCWTNNHTSGTCTLLKKINIKKLC